MEEALEEENGEAEALEDENGEAEDAFEEEGEEEAEELDEDDAAPKRDVPGVELFVFSWEFFSSDFRYPAAVRASSSRELYEEDMVWVWVWKIGPETV